MGIIRTWQSFRWHFAPKVEVSGTYTYNNAVPPTITQAAGDFVADGFLADHKLDVTGTVNNNHRYTIDSVAALTLTLSTSDTLTAEGPVASNLVGTFRDPDGLEEFPSELGSQNLVRAAGFTGGLNYFPGTFGANMVVSINALAADAAYSVDEYMWYLSSRTDDTSKQYLQITQYQGVYAAGTFHPYTYSGTVILSNSALAKSELGFTGSTDISTRMIREIFKHCALYVKRVSDGAIQWFDLYKMIVNP